MSNRLAFEKSPYLLQHKDNPVDWWPWGAEAFVAARETNRPIFLSIGYATCHWCHVMERESFEDVEVARLLNESFINIKVDREERPDIDAIYMNACQISTGRGGWPLTVMMTPAMRPFLVGTYFPRTARYGHEGMLQIIPKVAEVWQKNRDQIERTADEFVRALEQSADLDLSGEELSVDTLHRAFQHFEQQYDPVNGGFGRAPKFPSPERMRFLLRYWHRTQNPKALEIIQHTLQKMRRGGLYDQLGGGFHRYSTDEIWRVPHFEKMLYDQALLILIYLEVYQATGGFEYMQTVSDTLQYVHRELHHPDGAYFTGEDADSEGVEGKYYVWEMEEIHRLLKSDEVKQIAHVFNLNEGGNYLDEATHQRTGNNIFYRTSEGPLEDHATLEDACNRLFRHRSKRVRPLLDDKVLTDWNGLMITALAQSGVVLEDPKFIRRAEKCVRFIEKNMMPEPGRLLHRWREGEAAIEGLLDDYAYMIMGLLALYEATDQEDYCTLARALTQTVLDDFRSEKGDFFMVKRNGEPLLLRPRQPFDSAIPSGNSVMIMNLFRLARVIGDPDLEATGHQSIEVYSGGISKYPDGFSATLTALDYGMGPSTEIIVSGPGDQQETQAALADLRKVYAPNVVILARPNFGGVSEFAIHVCHGATCELPTQDTEAVIARIARAASQR
ncbi:MAG: thioredoxin domain-containing protein [Rhodothermaceae bacterium]|nr:thioredoxin domain-containing protein [Rhodothermaceae bacterium]MXZ58828.1 thioredoxin domain-containing protein [Rhodothermaceae bacterium]MYB92166.1 thioredoxin domain-containing protein [Rhodothermaceae bacterium]MYD67330.1 thioredoxin domain-containing protein [Rhodothermaceae bacterium]MYG44711.1 thioredoxin domain-containing protein [Rhodothermaceae bacterium]